MTRRPWRRLTQVPVTLLVAFAILLAVGVLTPIVVRMTGSTGTGSGPPPPPGTGDATSLSTTIAAAQARLHAWSTDWQTWARLGSAYIEQGRITADPSYYPKAEEALRRSLSIESADNWQAMVGMGALANARHDFPGAVTWGQRAQAIDSYSASVYGVLADAFTQLGNATAARDATQRMLNLQPNVASFTRASYDFEQHGQVDAARGALQRAASDSSDPADIAFCRYYLGELAFNNGDPQGALNEYAAGIRIDPSYELLYAGRAKALAALGQTAQALVDYDRVVQLLPLPQLVIEYGDVLTSAGQQAKAQQQYDLFAAQERLFTSNGVSDHLTSAVFLADHGQPVPALSEARAEWAARQSVSVADGLAWALHRNGRDAEALTYAIRATSLGWHNATFYYHRGAIYAALGQRTNARRDLAEALAVNPHFDIMQAPLARQLLASLGGPQ